MGRGSHERGDTMTKAERSSHELQRDAIKAGRQSPWVKARAQGDYVARRPVEPTLGDRIPADRKAGTR